MASAAAVPATSAVHVTPNPVIAPVGSEVVLLASVCGGQGFLLTNERVEWSLAPGSVGNFVGVGFNGISDWLFGNFRRGKVDNAFVVGTTNRDSVRMTRGTPTPADDVCVLAGQAWVSLTSPVEGSSFVTAYAPHAPVCNARLGAGVVHWVDAQWQFPPPAISPVGGRHVFTTSVTRHSDQSPCAGWRVRYEVIEGPPAGFAPAGSRVVELETNPAGQASAEIFQQEQVPGTNRIAIQIVRPALGACPQPLVVAYGSVLKTWSAPQIAVRMSGPAVGAVGAELTYQITISNPGDLPAEDVVLVDQLPESLSYVSSNPAAEVSGRKLQWRLGRLAGRESRPLTLAVRAESRGPVNHCVDATAAPGLKARDCAATTIGSAELELTMSQPDPVTVGGSVTFDMVLANRGMSPATNLLIKDRFDEGLVHAASASPIQRELAYLAPGESKQIRIIFQATKAGQLCHEVEVTGPGGIAARAKGCATVQSAPTPSSPPPAAAPVLPKPTVPPTTSPSTPGTPAPDKPEKEKKAEKPEKGDTAPTTPPAATPAQPPPFGRPAVSVDVNGPQSATSGEAAEFVIVVQNTGTQRLTKITVVSRFDSPLEPTEASAGFSVSGNELVWKLDQMTTGQTERFVVHYRCARPSSRACNRVSVTTQEAASAQTEACLEIRAAPPLAPPAAKTPAKEKPAPPPTAPSPPAAKAGDLTLTVADLRDPVAGGKEVTYEIRVSNGGAGPDQQVALTVSLPTGMQPVSLGTSGPTSAKTEGQTIRFEPVPQVAAGQTLTYRVRAKTQQPGDMRVRAEVTSRANPRPVAAEETTQVF